MLTKLAFKNMSKSIRDYGVYFLTLVLGVSIFYMFNSIYDQKDVMLVTEAVSASMIALRKILSIISVFVAVVLGCLIVYANNFFIKRRKKELGIYMTLGMNKGKISTILLLETSILAVVALALGLVLGVFGSQFMSIFTATIFEADMSGFKFIFSLDATVKSILYFAIIFIVVAIFNLLVINKYKLIDLIYGDRKNEQLKVRSVKVSLFLFAFSIVFLVAAYILILENGIININQFFFASLVCGTIGTVLFFFSVSGLLVKLIQSRKHIYFRNLNMFVTRQLSSKINTNFISISVVCIVLLLVIGIFSCGYSLQNLLSKDLREAASYDFSLLNYFDTNIYEGLPENIKSQDIIFNEIEVYDEVDNLTLSSLSSNCSSNTYDLASYSLSFVLLSDYNKALEMQGKQPIKLDDDSYLIMTNTDAFKRFAEQIIEENSKISLNGMNLAPNKKIRTDSITNTFGNIYFIVNDNLKDVLQDLSDSSYHILNINCKDEEQSSYVDEILDKELNADSSYNYYLSKASIYDSSISSKAIISFLAIYLGIVFMICCVAILAIQQLSEAADNKTRYDLLNKLGADKGMLNKALFTQILCYFLFPLLLALVHSAVGLTAANKVIQDFGKIDITLSIVVTSTFIIAVYGAYFGFTYMGSKNIINKR